MKATEFIKVVRDDLKELYEMHQLAVSTDGQSGLLCFNPEQLIEKMNRSDREILEFYIAQGAEIDDADEYLNSIGQ